MASGHLRSSRLADLYQMTTLLPSLISCPARIVSRVVVLREWMSGVVQRMNSFVAAGSRERSAWSLPRSAGNWVKASIDLVIVGRVVWLVATIQVAKFSQS